MGSRDLFIDEAHIVLGIFPVFFPCMLPTPLCGIFAYKLHIAHTLYMQEIYFEPEKDDLSENLDGKFYKGKMISNIKMTSKRYNDSKIKTTLMKAEYDLENVDDLRN